MNTVKLKERQDGTYELEAPFDTLPTDVVQSILDEQARTIMAKTSGLLKTSVEMIKTYKIKLTILWGAVIVLFYLLMTK